MDKRTTDLFRRLGSDNDHEAATALKMLRAHLGANGGFGGLEVVIPGSTAPTTNATRPWQPFQSAGKLRERVAAAEEKAFNLHQEVISLHGRVVRAEEKATKASQATKRMRLENTELRRLLGRKVVLAR